MAKRYVVFLSHAGEDKETIALPLYKELVRRGICTFLDKPELQVGRKAVPDMYDAMNMVRIALFILSPEFVAKEWPIRELIYLQQLAAKDGGLVLIPIFYRLTIADCKYRTNESWLQEYGDLFQRFGFLDRACKGTPTVDEVRKALSDVTGWTGVENDGGLSNEASDEMRKRREEWVREICDKVQELINKSYSTRKRRRTTLVDDEMRDEVEEECGMETLRRGKRQRCEAPRTEDFQREENSGRFGREQRRGHRRDMGDTRLGQHTSDSEVGASQRRRRNVVLTPMAYLNNGHCRAQSLGQLQRERDDYRDGQYGDDRKVGFDDLGVGVLDGYGMQEPRHRVPQENCVQVNGGHTCKEFHRGQFLYGICAGFGVAIFF